MIDAKDCVGISKLVLENESTNINAVDLYNKWVSIRKKTYSAEDTQWILDFIKRTGRVDRRLLRNSLAVDTLSDV